MRFTIVNFVYPFYTIVKGFYLSKLLSVTSTNFCTIIINITKDVKAIPFTEPEKIHNPQGIAVDSLTSFVFSQPFFEKLSSTFVSTLPELGVLFLDRLMERHRLETHDYHASAMVRSMRSSSDRLLDFVKLHLRVGRTMKLL